jgi:hypothetical protein
VRTVVCRIGVDIAHIQDWLEETSPARHCYMRDVVEQRHERVEVGGYGTGWVEGYEIDSPGGVDIDSAGGLDIDSAGGLDIDSAEGYGIGLMEGSGIDLERSLRGVNMQ